MAPPADRAGDHVAPSFAFYFSYGISNLAPRAEADTPKIMPYGPTPDSEGADDDPFVNKHYFDNYKRMVFFKPFQRDFL